MNFQRLFSTIDTHTGGNPTRTLISGLPELQGDTMSEKMLYMEKNYDWIRKFLMNEPRGHGVMSGRSEERRVGKEGRSGGWTRGEMIKQRRVVKLYRLDVTV